MGTERQHLVFIGHGIAANGPSHYPTNSPSRWGPRRLKLPDVLWIIVDIGSLIDVIFHFSPLDELKEIDLRFDGLNGGRGSDGAEDASCSQ